MRRCALLTIPSPVYAAECSPAAIRGALVMMWQMWTAYVIYLHCSEVLVLIMHRFGMMIGNIMGVAFGGLEPDLAWFVVICDIIL